MGVRAAQAESQLLGCHGSVGRQAAPHAGLGAVDGWCLYFSTGRQSRKAKNLATNSTCVIATENAAEAVVLEGVARETREVPLRRKFIRDTERKYKFDMSGFTADILNLKEPIYVVEPRVAFGLHEKKSLNTATRWHFAK
jgi:hypothetical protein